MTPTTQPIGTFAYRAQTPEGQPLSGTIDAVNAEEAADKLVAIRLRVTELAPAAAPPPKAKPLRGDDFIAFNQQLAHLAKAGLPIEQGLRLIAQDMQSGRLATTIRQIADDLDKGVPLAAALEKHQKQFPAMYGRLIDAGVKANNLPGMLFNLSRHLELVQRLRATLWRSIAYPLMVLAGLSLVVTILSWVVLPQFRNIYKDFRVQLPAATQIILAVGEYLPWIILGIVAIILAVPILAFILRRTGLGQKLADVLLLPLPLIGPVLKRNLLAGWCNAVKMGVEAGLDLPAAIQLAGDVSTSPRLRSDSMVLITELETGRMPGSIGRPRVLPPVVTAAIDVGIKNHNLAETLGGLSQMYSEQAEMRLGTLPGIISPALLLMTGAMVAFVIAALFLPLVTLIGAVSGSSSSPKGGWWF